MEDKNIWVVNVSNEVRDKIIPELQRHIIFEPQRPVQMPWSIAQKYINNVIRICDNPDKFFNAKPLRHLTIRDAGIGDLLLLEPCLRQSKISSKNKRNVSIVSRYPDVYLNHPMIDRNLKMDSKDDLRNINFMEFDCYDDLRNYSETCVNRETKHRTDCYNQVYKLEIEDKEPRLYFDKDEKNTFFEKKQNKTYIGINFDASHHYRRFEKGEQVIEHLLNVNSDHIIIVLGSYDFVKIKKNKRIIDLQGKTTIREAINIIRDLDYLVAADSGLMHVGLTLHVPTVCIFSIIFPYLRGVLIGNETEKQKEMAYYKGPYKVIFETKKCKGGCGSHHMATCDYGDKKKNQEFIPPCMDIDPFLFWEKIKELSKNDNKRVFYNENVKETKQKVIQEVKQEQKQKIIKPEINQINFNKLDTKKLTMPIIVQDESKNLPRFIELVMKHPAIGRVIAIDGGSKDNTVELLEKAGAEVYVHPYIKTYHMQQAFQREISFSYVNDNTPCIYFDIDECMNKDLYDYLPQLAENCPDYGLIARKTFDYFADINDESKRIKDWPDPQPRVVKWNKHYKFVNGAHHQMLNAPAPIRLPINMYIIHFEKENKDRDELESQWANMMLGVKKYK